jgi:hypothetical protein
MSGWDVGSVVGGFFLSAGGAIALDALLIHPDLLMSRFLVNNKEHDQPIGTATGAATSGAATSGAAITGAATSGAATSGAATSGAATSGAATSGAAITGAATTQPQTSRKRAKQPSRTEATTTLATTTLAATTPASTQRNSPFIEECKNGETKTFPAHWKDKPEITTRDWVKWPEGYGCGSSSIGTWIKENLAMDKAQTTRTTPAATTRPETTNPATTQVPMESCDLPDHDWGCYLERYPDLQTAFNGNRLKAKAHWYTYGKIEERDCTCPHPTPASTSLPSSTLVSKLAVTYATQLPDYLIYGNRQSYIKFDKRRLNSDNHYRRELHECVNGKLGPPFIDSNGQDHFLKNPALDDFPNNHLYFRLQDEAGLPMKQVIKRLSVFMKYNPAQKPPPEILSSERGYTWTLSGSNDEYKGQHGSTMNWTSIEVTEQQVHAHADDVPYANTNEPFQTMTILKNNGEPAYNSNNVRQSTRAWVRYDIITANNTAYNLYHIRVTPDPGRSGISLSEILLN